MSYYASYQPDPRKNIFGLSLVAVLHIVVIYALISGLARKVVDVVRAPIETKLIEEIQEKPKPKEVIPPPRVDTPPPPFVPPPEVTITTAPPDAGITAVVATPPPQAVFTPTPAPVEAPPPPPPAKPATVSIGVACPTRPLPKLSPKQEGVAGSVRVRLTVKDNKVATVDILNSSPRGLFDAVVRNAVLQYGCQTTGDQTVVAETTFNFTAE